MTRKVQLFKKKLVKLLNVNITEYQNNVILTENYNSAPQFLSVQQKTCQITESRYERIVNKGIFDGKNLVKQNTANICLKWVSLF